MLTRREFVLGSAATLAGTMLFRRLQAAEAGAGKLKIRVGSCGVGLEDAKKAGLEGVEISAGGAAETLEIGKPETWKKHQEQMQSTGLVISSIMMGLFNQYPLASDPRGPAWLDQTIEGAKNIGAGVILVAFFGKGSLLDDGRKVKKADVDVVVERLKAAAPKAEKAKVILGIENTLCAKDNAEILDRIGSPAVKIYYDSFNLSGMGYDVCQEIRFLKDRVCQHHFKNGPAFLEDGKVKFGPVAEAIKEVGYQGWVVLETSNPTKDRIADQKRNAEYVRKLFA